MSKCNNIGQVIISLLQIIEGRLKETIKNEIAKFKYEISKSEKIEINIPLLHEYSKVYLHPTLDANITKISYHFLIEIVRYSEKARFPVLIGSATYQNESVMNTELPPSYDELI